MTIWDKVRKGVGQVASEVSNAAEGLRVQTEIGGLETDLQSLYVSAGKRAKELVRAGAIKDSDLETIVRHTDEIEAKIDELRKLSVGGHEQPGQCPGCKAEVSQGAQFCAACGAKIEG